MKTIDNEIVISPDNKGYHPDFSIHSNLWCLHCGGGDCIRSLDEVRTSREADILDMDGNTGIEDISDEGTGETIFMCTSCGEESGNLHDLATDLRSRGYSAFLSFNNYAREDLITEEEYEDETNEEEG